MNRSKYISGVKRRAVRYRPISKGDRVKIKAGTIKLTDKYFTEGIWEVGRRVHLDSGEYMFEIHQDHTMMLLAPSMLERV
jgi:hypothetical protein